MIAAYHETDVHFKKEISMKRKLLCIAALSVSFCAMPMIAHAAEAGETVIKMRDVPDKVKHEIDHQRGDYAVKQVILVERDGRKFYRVVIDKKGPEDQIVRIGEDGEVLSADVDRDVRAEATPAAEVVAADEGTPIEFDSCPGGVKTTIGEAATNSKVIRVTTYAHRGTTIYRAVVSDGNRDRVIRVSADGKLYHEEDVTPAGGKVVEWDSVPYKAKVAGGKEAGASKVTKVYQFTKDNTTHYRVVLDSGRNFDVTDAGSIVQVDDNGATPTRRSR
jgi:hypothetical protein